MKRIAYSCFSLLLFALCVLPACTHDNLEDLGLSPAPCDTAAISYLTTIRAILAANCYNCHSSADPSAGVVLDTHAGVSLQAGRGKLLGVVSHAPGFVRMPQGGDKLPDCDIAKIKAWIDAGAPDN